MVAYHGSIGARTAILSHTYNPGAVWEVPLNGVAVGESALNALVALHHHVPVLLITGDDATAEEARAFLPEMATWIRGVSRADARTVTLTGDDPLSLYRSFVTIIALTRSIVER
jgi:D-aminopeptidase